MSFPPESPQSSLDSSLAQVIRSARGEGATEVGKDSEIAVDEAVSAPGPSVAVRLSELLGHLTAAELGFDSARIPAAVETNIPLAAFASQRASGAVSVPLSTVVSGLEARLRPAFAKADPHLEIKLPLQEIAAQLPPPREEPAHESKEEPAADTVSAPQSGVTAPPTSYAWQTTPPPAVTTLPTPEPDPRNVVRSQEPPPVAVQPTAPVEFPPAPEIVGTESLPQSPVMNDPAAQPKPAEPAAQNLEVVTEFADSPTQILLKAVLGTGGTVTVAEVLRLASAIDGVCAVVAIAGDRLIEPERDAADAAAQEFSAHAVGRYKKLKALLQEFGAGRFEMVTVTLASRTISFFAGEGCTLAALHREAGLPAGVREKLVVIARNLGAML